MRLCRNLVIFVIIFLLSTLRTSTQAGSRNFTSNEDFHEVLINHFQVLTYLELHEKTINHLKHFEGFVSNRYKCPAGATTIGYGHVILKTDTIGYKVTEVTATEILKSDLEKAIVFVEKHTDLDRYREPNKVLALAQFTFNVGIGNFQRSTLRKLVLSGDSIDSELLKWTKYKRNGEYVHSNHLLLRRKTELEIFYTNYEHV